MMMRSVDDVLEEVLAVHAVHAGKIGTHSGRCYQYHAGCLAVLVRDLLADEWEGITVTGLRKLPDARESVKETNE